MSRRDEETDEQRTYRRALQFRVDTVSTLQHCLCSYPFERYGTTTEHAGSCPAHAVIETYRDGMPELVDAQDPDGAICRICGCVDRDCLNCIRRTGMACSWVELDLCSACAPVAEQLGELASRRADPHGYSKGAAFARIDNQLEKRAKRGGDQ